MLHCRTCIRNTNSIPSLLSDLGCTPLILTSSPPPCPLPLLPTGRPPRHSIWPRRGYTAQPSSARDVPPDVSPPVPLNRIYGSYKKSNLQLELRWLKDPVKLAEHVVNLLRGDDLTKALEIVRLASKDVECTVSWNHLIDYEMSKTRVTNAVKLYNEMKKRAQLPDAYTFTILFRGLSWYPHSRQSTARALSLYQSMFAENSPVRPTIIHTNAVLKVCALANDVDALLGIAAELPVRGSGAPDTLTFTIILNAIRGKASTEFQPPNATSGEEDSKRYERTALAVQQGRRLWLEVRQRWMSGDLRMDEEFVCAMGRLLLLGHEAQNTDDVLSLLEQTMDIPRQIARITDPALERADAAEEASGPQEDLELPPDSSAKDELETLLLAPKEEANPPNQPSDPFAALATTARRTQPAVRPGCNTLSLVLSACIRLNYVRAAQNYWGLLTAPNGRYRINPDSENYHMYLRLLRLQRSSKLTVELVDEWRSGKLPGQAGALQTKTFRVALSCCVRDARNRNSVVHAGKLVRMMTDSLPHPDAKALSMYLDVALRQVPRDWRVIMGVIRGTELGVRNLRSLLAYDRSGPQKQTQEDVLALVKKLVGAFDVALDLGNEEITAEERKNCKEQRFTLAAYITRMHTKYKQIALERQTPEDETAEDEEMGGKRRPFQKRPPRASGGYSKGNGRMGLGGRQRKAFMFDSSQADGRGRKDIRRRITEGGEGER